jgi:hypothetical protein
MEQLRKAIGVLPQLAICTDACKGLEVAQASFSLAELRDCFRHLMEIPGWQFSSRGRIPAETRPERGRDDGDQFGHVGITWRGPEFLTGRGRGLIFLMGLHGDLK